MVLKMLVLLIIIAVLFFVRFIDIDIVSSMNFVCLGQDNTNLPIEIEV
jgi:hypothetical protein